MGIRFVGEIVSPVVAFSSGRFKLVPAGDGSPIVEDFISRAKNIGFTCHGIDSLDDLKGYLRLPDGRR